MSKRSHTQLHTSIDPDGQPLQKTRPSGIRRRSVTDDMGQFEDAWEDEIEEELVQNPTNDPEVDEEEDIMETIHEDEDDQGHPRQPEPDAFIPGRHALGKDEILEPDDSVYEMRHSVQVKWPSLSFDVLRDNLGDQRQRYPATAYIVAGTQASSPKDNDISVYKMSALHRTQNDGDDSDSDDQDDADALDEDAVLEFRSVPHFGGVNRLRAQPLPTSVPFPPVSQPYYVSTWAETGKVHIWDVRPLLEALDVPGYTYDKNRVNSPVFTITSHGRAEGFAVDWASSGNANPSALRLLTGDIHSKIYLTTTGQAGFNASPQPFTTHTSSVEDLQWSPSESSVFASCSADRSIQIWDVRIKGKKSAAGIDRAHETDVNVISWNKLTAYLLLSGGDEGAIKAWDLRNIKKKGSTNLDPAPVASFSWHRAPVTSIEWHPTEDSIFAASGADDQVTLWDLAVEQDDDEMVDGAGGPNEQDIPPQLLFVHQGQKDVKEIHWHPQIPGAVISTALDGFNVFKTISV
ncbi:glutamate-rich WD repeat containing 1 [Thelephora ganbajun]|uniref:Glutamate-rich WD repeat containing 1 n=1 Tax=Thelephora ganbajun TaxID=370292 RepID=A0ACB6ZRL1_THEGA|nr:glutamate-rich WD repeat containing 1 [Thelephora ganbajun]